MKLIPAIMLSVLVFAACKKEEEDPVPSTPVDPKQKFIADWTCTEVSRRDPPAQPFQIHCTSASGDTILLENFYALGFTNKAKLVVSGDSVNIKPINQQVGSVYVLSGKGKWVNTSKFTMTYIVDDGNVVKDTVDATFTK